MPISCCPVPTLEGTSTSGLTAHSDARPEHELSGRHDRGSEVLLRGGGVRPVASALHLHLRRAGILEQAAAVGLGVMHSTVSAGAKACRADPRAQRGVWEFLAQVGALRDGSCVPGALYRSSPRRPPSRFLPARLQSPRQILG